MIEKAIQWIKNNTIAGQGIITTSSQRTPYPEVTGYFIPTLLSVGKRNLAQQYAKWLLSVQREDGSFRGGGDNHSYAFDTGQVIRGWVALLDQMPELESPLRRACDWILSTADPQTGRLLVPQPGMAWNLGSRGEVNEGIHLYTLAPLRQAGKLLNEIRYTQFVDKSLSYYLKNVNLTDFNQPNALTHFFAYIQEALLELGCENEARKGMGSVAIFQQPTGAVPGYHDVNWVCSTGLAQLAKVWYQIGETERADAALKFLSLLQNPSGGFFGSYGIDANYFPSEEISWAVKYIIEAVKRQIVAHFDQTVNFYQKDINEEDGRVQAVLHHLGNLNGKRVLDAGSGKGRYAAIIKRHFPQADITAMDISAEMLKHAPPGIRTVQHSILNIPFADGEFDAVICIEALEHVVHIEAGVNELARVLAPGGKLIIIDKNKDKLGTLKMPSWEKWFKREELLAMIRANGLDANAEFIEYDNVKQPDGLFICWVGRKTVVSAPVYEKPEKTSAKSLSQVYSVMLKNFFRTEPYDEVNSKLLAAAKQGRYDVLIRHLFEQDSKLFMNPVDFYSDELIENRPGMKSILNIFTKNTPLWLANGRKSVLEIGTGGGFLAYKLAKLGYHVTALDPSAPRVFVHQATHPEKSPCLPIRFVFAVAELMPFNDDEFDFVISQETLEHVFDLGKTLSEICRVVKSDAQFFHQFPKGNFTDGPNHLRHFSEDVIREVFNTHPMHIDQIELIPYLVNEQANNWFVSGTIVKGKYINQSKQKVEDTTITPRSTAKEPEAIQRMLESEWDLDIEELKYIVQKGIMRSKYPDMLKHGGVELTNTCNLRCNTCCTTYSKAPRGFANDRIIKLAIKYAEFNQSFSFHRLGEPLLHPRLVEYVKWASYCGLRTLISTNGILLTEDLFYKLLEAGLKELQITLHTEKSVRALQMVADYLIKNNLDNESFRFCGNLLSVNREKLLISSEVMRYVRRIGTHNWAGNIPGKHIRFSEDVINKRMGACFFLRNSICNICWDGTIVSCCFDSENDNILGHIENFPSLKHELSKYKLCDFCDPNWANMEMI